MTERRIEDPSSTIHFVPSHSEIVVRPMDTRVVRVVESYRIKTQQNVDPFARPLFGLIDFVIFDKRRRKVTNGGEASVFVDDRRIERRPRVLVEPSTDH